MPRPRSAVPNLHYHSASSQWRVNVPGARPRYFGRVEEEARRLYQRWAAEWLLDQAEGKTGPRGDISVSEAILAYYEHARTYYGTGGHLDRVWAGLEILDTLYGDIPAGDFGAKKLKAVRTHALTMEHKQKPGQLLSRNYVNALIRAIKTAWVWLESEEMVPRGAADHLKTVRALREGHGGVERPPVLPVDPAVVKATLPFCPSPVRAMVELGQLAGMRPGELVLMRRTDISTSPAEVLEPIKDLKVSAIAVDGVMIWFYCPATHKMEKKGKSRVIALGPQAQAVLQPFFEGRDPEAFLFSPQEAREAYLAEKRRQRKTKVQPSQRCRAKRWTKKKPGQRYTSGSFAQSIEVAAEKADAAAKAELAEKSQPVPEGRIVPHWAPNRLRHHVATEANEEADLSTAAAVLGHSNPQTTLIYARQAIRKAAALMARTG